MNGVLGYAYANFLLDEFTLIDHPERRCISPAHVEALQTSELDQTQPMVLAIHPDDLINHSLSAMPYDAVDVRYVKDIKPFVTLLDGYHRLEAIRRSESIRQQAGFWSSSLTSVSQSWFLDTLSSKSFRYS